MRWTLLINLSPPPPLENHVGITILFLINGLNAITKQKTISPEAAAGGGGDGGGARAAGCGDGGGRHLDIL